MRLFCLFCLLGAVIASDHQSSPSIPVDATDPIKDVPHDQTKEEELNDKDALYKSGVSNLYGLDQQDRNIEKAVAQLNQSASLGHGGAQFMMAFFHTNGLFLPRSEARTILFLTFAAMNDNTQAQLSLATRHLYGYSVSKSCGDSVRYYKKVADKVAKLYKESGVLAHIEKVSLHDEGALQQRQTEEDIMQYYQYSADKGDTQSTMILGRAYMFGTRGVQQDALLAKHYFDKAVDAGEAAGHGGLGQLHAQGVEGGPHPLPRNYTAAAIHFKKGAELGHPVSLNGMGFLHMGGHGVPLNYTEAARYFQMAADLSNAEGQYNLGVLHLNGEGVPRDTMKALKYLQLASQQGQILAHYQLGNMYSEGIGVPQANCNMAVKFYKAVCEKGAWNTRIEDAHDAYLHGEYTNALLDYLIVAEEGYEVGQSNVAYMFDHHLGLEDFPQNLVFSLRVDEFDAQPPESPASESDGATAESLQESAQLFKARANQTLSLKELYRERAFMWYKRSAEQANIDSIIRLGDYYYYGWGTPVDMVKSVESYREAADRSNPRALFNLGYMHQAGISLPRDFHLAKRYYDQAAAQSDKAWAPVQLALAWLFIRQWYSELAPTGHIMVRGYKLEDIVLTALIGLLTLLLYLRSIAVRGPRQ
eukprot:GGOE01003901.1.p1 GENE.GGOE01003901.1~~GGOE01003901.1.p1  ORF type:complete len:645 (+),score=127.68 GGOE01003901.1:63-1997(+)